MDGPAVDLFLWSTKSLPKINCICITSSRTAVRNTASGLRAGESLCSQPSVPTRC